MTNKQIMADLGQALLISELKTPDKFTNTGVTYDDTTTINSRSVGMGSYDGSADYQTFDASQIKCDKKIISFWIKPDFDSGTGGDDQYLLSMMKDNVITGTQTGVIFYGDVSGHNLRFRLYDNSSTQTFQFSQAMDAANTLRHVVIFLDNGNGLSGDVAFRIYIDGAVAYASASSWNTFNFDDLCLLGAGTTASNYYDGGIYDFCIYDYQSDQFLRNHTETDIVTALYNNTWGNNPSFLFSHEYRYLQDIAKEGNNESAFKVELKKRSNTSLTTYDSAFTDITSYVNSIGDIEIGLKDDEQDYAEITVDNVTINFDNKLGYFNDNTWEDSLWYGAYALQNSYMRVSIGFKEQDEDGLWIEYVDPVFKGIISEPDIDYSVSPSVDIELLHYINLLDQRYVHEIEVGIKGSISSSGFLYFIFSNFINDFGDVFGISYSGSSLRSDYIMSRSEYINKSQYSLLKDIIKKTGSFIVYNSSYISINYLGNEDNIISRSKLENDSDTEALWYFEETSGDYLDETSNGNDLSVVGSPTRGVETILGTGFNSYNGQARKASSLVGVPLNDDICYEFIVKFNNITYNNGASRYLVPVIGYLELISPFACNFEFGINTIGEFCIKYGGTDEVGDDTSLIIENYIADNQWYYIAVNISYTNNYIEVFINGELKKREYRTMKTGITYDFFVLPSSSDMLTETTIDSIRISSKLRDHETEIKPYANKLYGSISKFGDNIGFFYDYGKSKNILRDKINYDTGIKNIRNYIVSEGNREEYIVNFVATTSGSGSELFLVRLGENFISYYNGVDYTDMETLSIKINEDKPYNVTSTLISDTEMNLNFLLENESDPVPSVYGSNWTSIVFDSGVSSGTIATGFFTANLTQKTLLSKNDDSINKYGKKIELIENEKGYIHINDELQTIAESILANKKDKKFSIEYDARYLENVFTPGSKASVFSKASINLDNTIGENGSYNGSPYIGGVVRNTKYGGYIPWADRDTTKDIWITGMVISPENKTVTWKGREV